MLPFGDIWTPTSVLTAILAGAIAGAGMALLHPMLTLAPWRRTLHHAGMVAWLGALFFIGRIAVSVEAGDPQTGRLVLGASLWLLFALATIPAGLLTYRFLRDR